MVISTGMLHSLKDPVKVFREIHRLLKMDATAWILDPASVASLITEKNGGHLFRSEIGSS